MLTAAVLTDKPETAMALDSLATRSGHVGICKVLNSNESPYAVARAINGNECDLVFCDLSNGELTSDIVTAISAQCPATAMIGLASQPQSGTQNHADAAGLELLSLSTLTEETFDRAVDRAIHRLPGGMPENLMAFMPAKAGSGCTTVVLNAARNLRTCLGQRVLLIDGDLRSGILATLTNCTPKRSLTDVLMKSGQLDSSLWAESVIRDEEIDLLPRLAFEEDTGLPWIPYHQLLRFLKSRYDAILVDLPEIIGDGRTEFLRHAHRVYLVCSPELPALRLTQERCEELDDLGVEPERVSVIVNRWHKNDLKPSDLQQILNRNVAGAFPEEWQTVRDASLKSGFVRCDTELGKAILEFARQLARDAATALTGYHSRSAILGR
ncbi:MAG: hypothetical protein LLG20_18075 [Acidobacteriales bacterium]|nr:hypothetical protein [Terriglobales bacterium]